MKGKNLGKIRPPRNRRDWNWAGGRQDVLSSSPSSSLLLSLASSSSSSSLSSCSSSFSDTSCPERPVILSLATIPCKLDSVASAICYTDSVQSETVEVVLHFSSIAKQLLFPLETCIFFDKRAENWIAPMAVDPAYLNAKIFTSLYHFDVILPRRSSHASQRTRYHHHKALSLLRERVFYGNDDARLSNNTVSVVLGLAGHAFWTGDLRSATNHMKGMRKITNLRGGLSAFRDNEKLLAEMLRCDLGIAVHSGALPIFFNSASSSELRLPFPALTLFLRHPAPKCSRRADSATFARDHEISGELALVWVVLSKFCSVVKLAADSERRISVGTFLDTMASIMYRLLDMHFEVASSKENIRLGLPCFSCSVFLHWQHLGMSYTHLASVFRGCFAGLTAKPFPLSPQLVLWLLVTGAVSVFDGSDDIWLLPLLRKMMGTCKVDSWSEMRDLLMSFLWIGLVHDRTGKRVFGSAVC